MPKTVAEKLQIKPNTTVWLSDPAHLPLLAPMPEGVLAIDERWSALRFRANRPGEGRFTRGPVMEFRSFRRRPSPGGQTGRPR